MNDETKIKEIVSHKLIGEYIYNQSKTLANSVNTYGVMCLDGQNFAMGNFVEHKRYVRLAVPQYKEFIVKVSNKLLNIAETFPHSVKQG